MTSPSKEVRLSRPWNLLPEPDIDSKFLALDSYWNKDTSAVTCITCKYALQTSQGPHVDDDSSKTFAGRLFPGYCQFGEVIYDVVVRLCQSECYSYREHLSLTMPWATDHDRKDEDVAEWLGGPSAGVEELASQIVPIFLMWTRAAREQSCKRSM
jgi:hypothetical protein